MFDYRSLFNLDGRRALVVGAGSGIGRASAHGLAAFGADVICSDIDAASADATAQEIRDEGGNAIPHALDICDGAAVSDALSTHGAFDILVCTPGVNVRKPVLELSEDEFETIVGLNLRGTFNITRGVARGMAARGRGSIIVFSSMRAAVVEPGQGVYAATKAGVVQLVRALAAELGPEGVRANVIAPGPVETPLTAQIKEDAAWYEAYATKGILGRWAQPHEMVGAVIYLASDASTYVSGSHIFVDGGWTATDGRFAPPL